MSRLQLAGALALVLVSTGLFAVRCVSDPAIPFVVQDGDAPWIMYPLKPTGQMGLVERDALPVTHFVRRFELPAAGANPGDASFPLRVRALRTVRVWLNDEEISAPDPSGPGHWRHYRTLDAKLRPGTNELRVEITNPTGPALLSLRLEGPGDALLSDEHWRVRTADLPAKPAVRVDTARVNPSSFAMPASGESLLRRRNSVLALLVLGALIFLVVRQPAARRAGPALALGLPLLAVALWATLFYGKALAIPLNVGFDAHHHVKYVDFLREHGRLPLATDGWMMFHPPVYYAPAAALVELQEAVAPGSESLFAWKLLGGLAGLGGALLCWALARRLFGAGSRETAAAALFAAALPMNLAIASYVTNETLHAAWATAVVLATAVLLLAPRPSLSGIASWALLVSLAVLTKYTAWIVAGVAGFFLAVAWWRIEHAAPAQLARRLGLALAVVLLSAGWFYVRNVAHFGVPFPLNVDLPGETRHWWSQPGYYMPAFFLHFGQVLEHPFLAGTHTAWNSLYATLWGDGQLAGQIDSRQRHGYWDWELMAASYWLALPMTALLLLGAVRALRLALRSPEPSQRAVYSFLLTLSWALLLAVLYMTLRMQDYGQAKAFYALAGMGPLAVFFALGAGGADRFLEARGATWARALLWGSISAWAGSVWLSYLG